MTLDVLENTYNDFTNVPHRFQVFMCMTIQKIREGELIEEFGKMPIFESTIAVYRVNRLFELLAIQKGYIENYITHSNKHQMSLIDLYSKLITETSWEGFKSGDIGFDVALLDCVIYSCKIKAEGEGQEFNFAETLMYIIGEYDYLIKYTKETSTEYENTSKLLKKDMESIKEYITQLRKIPPTYDSTPDPAVAQALTTLKALAYNNPQSH